MPDLSSKHLPEAADSVLWSVSTVTVSLQHRLSSASLCLNQSTALQLPISARTDLTVHLLQHTSWLHHLLAKLPPCVWCMHVIIFQVCQPLTSHLSGWIRLCAPPCTAALQKEEASGDKSSNKFNYKCTCCSRCSLFWASNYFPVLLIPCSVISHVVGKLAQTHLLLRGLFTITCELVWQ